jgi:hypothetical protein
LTLDTASRATTAPHVVDVPETDEIDEVERPWQVVVWNDPIPV